jgi:beta-lactamase class A
MWIEQVNRLIAQTEGQVGLLINNLATGEVLFAKNEEMVCPSCSIIKVAVLLTLVDEAAAGRVELNQAAPLAAGEAAGSCGLTEHLSPGLPLTYRDYALFMIGVSDNMATNKLISLLGMEKINVKLAELGMKDTVLGRKMMDFEAKKQGRDNFTSCADMLILFSHLYNQPEKYTEALGILKRQQLNNQLAGWLDLDEFEFAHKTGELPGLRHDIGIMYLHEPIFVAFMSQELKQISDGNRLANEIGWLLYQNYK